MNWLPLVACAPPKRGSQELSGSYSPCTLATKVQLSLSSLEMRFVELDYK